MMKINSNKKGYVSVESILVAGALILTAVVVVNAYRTKSNNLAGSAISEMNKMYDAYNSTT